MRSDPGGGGMHSDDGVAMECAAGMRFGLGGRGDDLTAQVEAASVAIRSATAEADQADARTQAARASAEAARGARETAEQAAVSALAGWDQALAVARAARDGALAA